MELSPVLCKRAREKLEKDFPKLVERGQIRIINEDFLNYQPPMHSARDLHFLLFLEVLDNMPHDRVYYDEASKQWNQQVCGGGFVVVVVFVAVVAINRKNLLLKA